MIDLNGYQVVDAHCHPYPEAHPGDWSAFGSLFTLRVPDPARPLAEMRPVLLEQTLLEMARFFGCQADPAAVMGERVRRAEDLVAYSHSLMEDAGIWGMVVDFGYPQPPYSPDYLARMTGVRIGEVFRIEPLIKQLLEQTDDFYTFRTRYLEGLDKALARPKCVALKSIIAYRSGLAITLTGEDEARRCFAEGRLTGGTLKPLRDWCLQKAMEMCLQADKTMCIHTGAGDSEIRFDTARPELLYDLLTTQPYTAVRTVLVHGGYPWSRQTAFMVNVLDNVYMDISLLSPFSAYGVEMLLDEILHIAPVDKVMHGSDGFNLPEVAWMGAHLTRRALERVLGRLVESGTVRRSFAEQAARDILMENARRVFRL